MGVGEERKRIPVKLHESGDFESIKEPVVSCHSPQSHEATLVLRVSLRNEAAILVARLAYLFSGSGWAY